MHSITLCLRVCQTVFISVCLILSLLCLFAGSKAGLLENADILTLNTSLIFQEIPTSTGTSGSGLLGSITGSLESGANSVTEEIQNKLHLYDFYSLHLLDFCEGYYSSSGAMNESSSSVKNVTDCSNRDFLFTSNISDILQSEPELTSSLDSLPGFQSTFDILRTTSVATLLCYYSGIILSSISLILAGYLMVKLMLDKPSSRRLTRIHLIINVFAFTFFAIGSVVVTAIVRKIIDTFNNSDQIKIQAYAGFTFIGMTWSLTVLILLATLIHYFLRQNREVGREKAHQGYTDDNSIKQTALDPPPRIVIHNSGTDDSNLMSKESRTTAYRSFTENRDNQPISLPHPHLRVNQRS